jgi:hypothetical protein
VVDIHLLLSNGVILIGVVGIHYQPSRSALHHY